MIADREELKKEALTVAIAAAKLAGDHAKNLREKPSLNISLKGDRDLVTQADTECEKIIIDHIHSHFPDHLILSEESSSTFTEEMKTAPLWIIDPIDGTTNYAHGQLHVGVSIGFAVNGEREAGVVNCLFLNELYSASRGGGAFCNGEKITVREVSTPQEALITTGFPYQRDEISGVIKRLTAVLKKYRGLRRLGAAAVDLCWVAAGKSDGFYEDVCPWDVAAGLLIASEAGAFIGNYTEIHSPPPAWPSSSDTPRELDGSRIVVCSPGIAADLVATLNEDI